MTTVESERLGSARKDLIGLVPELGEDPYFLVHFVAGRRFGELHAFTSRPSLAPAMRSALRRLGAEADPSQGFWATYVHEFPIMAHSAAAEIRDAIFMRQPESELLCEDEIEDGDDEGIPEPPSEPYGERNSGAVSLESIVATGAANSWLARFVRTDLVDYGASDQYWMAERCLAFVARSSNGTLAVTNLRQLGLESRRVPTGEIMPTFENLDHENIAVQPEQATDETEALAEQLGNAFDSARETLIREAVENELNADLNASFASFAWDLPPEYGIGGDETLNDVLGDMEIQDDGERWEATSRFRVGLSGPEGEQMCSATYRISARGHWADEGRVEVSYCDWNVPRDRETVEVLYLELEDTVERLDLDELLASLGGVRGRSEHEVEHDVRLCPSTGRYMIEVVARIRHADELDRNGTTTYVARGYGLVDLDGDATEPMFTPFTRSR